MTLVGLGSIGSGAQLDWIRRVRFFFFFFLGGGLASIEVWTGFSESLEVLAHPPTLNLKP